MIKFQDIIDELPDLKGSFIGEIIEKMLRPAGELNVDFLSNHPDFNPETDERGLGDINRLEKELLSMSFFCAFQERELTAEIEKNQNSSEYGDIEDAQFVLADLLLRLKECRDKFERTRDLFFQNIHRRFGCREFDIPAIRKGGKIVLLKEKKILNIGI